MEKHLLVVASNFSRPVTGGLIWIQKFAEHSPRLSVNIETLDMSEPTLLNKKGKLARFIAAVSLILSRSNFVAFIDHSLFRYFALPFFFLRIFSSRKTYAIICHHMFYLTEKSLFKKIIGYILECLFIANARCVIVPSKEVADDLKSLFLLTRTVVIIEPTANLRAQKYRKKINHNRILFAGSIEPRKGVDTIIKTLASIKNIDYTCDIVGSYDENDPYYKILQKLIGVNGLNDRVIFRGRVSATEMRDYYNNANIFFFPSRHEGYGMVIVEAMSFALPIVAAKIPATTKLMKHGINGFLCPVDDIECFAHYLGKLLGDVRLQSEMGLKNFETGQRFRNWDDVVLETYSAIKTHLIDKQ